MRRREFITLLSGVAVGWPLGADAQQGDRMRRLGILMAGTESDPQYQADVAVFREGLQKLGWVDGCAGRPAEGRRCKSVTVKA
jgi:putative tryptophan/tyrosine transport system substrate-binding protein